MSERGIIEAINVFASSNSLAAYGWEHAMGFEGLGVFITSVLASR